MFLALDLPAELMLVQLFFGKLLVAPGLERPEAHFDGACLAAVEPDRFAGKILQKAAVVADEDERRAPRIEFTLQPLDGRQIEMVGRLIQQKNIRIGRQRAGERRAARLAAGNLLRVFIAGERERLHQTLGGMQVVERRQARAHIIAQRRKAGEIRLLRHVANGSAGLQEARAVIGLDQAGGDPEQRRFAGAVAPDQRRAVAFRNDELRALQ